MEDNIKRKIIMKNGWLIQQERTPNSATVKATQQKIHKDKDGNIIGRTNAYKEVSFSSNRFISKNKKSDDNEYILEEEDKPKDL
jgi:hypothetical protein